jgi:hypothetical protein
MVSVGAVVNDMREAQGLIMPLMLLLTFPFWVWFPISMSPNSAFSTTLSIPPVNTFAMLSASRPRRLTWWRWALRRRERRRASRRALVPRRRFPDWSLMTGKPPNWATSSLG